MRNVKRILCSVVAFAMLMSCMVFNVSAASFPDVPDGHANKTAIEQLSDLGVIQGDEKGNFNPDNNVNRAEFTALVMRFIGQSGSLGTISVADAPFTDLSDSSVSWAIGDIKVAHSMGIINGDGDGTFRPTDPVAYEEAVKMIVCALGYGKAIIPATDAALWYQPYLTIATEMGFTKNSGGAIGVPATRGSIAQMLFDAKDVKMVDQNGKVSDKTVLEDKLDRNKLTGIILNDQNTSLMAPDLRVREDEIQILAREDGEDVVRTYKTTNATYHNWIGYQVDFYYTEDRSDDNRTLTSATKKNTKEVTVDAKDIVAEESTATSISYYPEDASRSKTYNLSSDNVVIYNDKLYGSSANNSKFDPSMLPVVGNVTLIDTKGNGSYDVIKINKYDVYVVTGSTSTDSTITDNTSGEDRKLQLDTKNSSSGLKIVDTSGKEVTFSSINSNSGRRSVVCYKESNSQNGGEKLSTAVVINNSAKTGEVMGTSGSAIKIGNTSYDVSPAAPWVLYKDNASALKAPQIGDNATFYFDLNGAVVGYDKTAATTNQQYGYIMNAESASELDDDSLKVRILTPSGVKIYYSNKSTRLDKQTYSSASALESALMTYSNRQNTDLDESQRNGVYQMVKFTTKTNKGTVLDEIVPVTEVSETQKVIESDVLTRLNTISGTMEMKYTSSNKQLKQVDGNASVILGSNTKIFSVPKERDSSDYHMSSLSSLKNNTIYKVEVFDVSTSRIAAAAIVYGIDATTKVDTLTPVFAITKIEKEAENTTAGEFMPKLTGYQVSSSGTRSEAVLWISPESKDVFGQLSVGDIIRCGSDKDGYATIDEKDILWTLDNYDTTGNIICEDSNGKSEIEEAEFVVINAGIYDYDDANDYLTLSAEILGGGTYDVDKSIGIPLSDISNALFLDYRIDKGEVKEGGITEMEDSAESILKNSKDSQVFIYRTKGKVKLVVRFSND